MLTNHTLRDRVNSKYISEYFSVENVKKKNLKKFYFMLRMLGNRCTVLTSYRKQLH